MLTPSRRVASVAITTVTGVAGLAALAGSAGLLLLRRGGTSGTQRPPAPPAVVHASSLPARAALAPAMPSNATPSGRTAAATAVRTFLPSPLLSTASAAYARGDYRQASETARRVLATVNAARPKATPPERREAVQARHLIAFSAARQHDLQTARTQFALLRTEAKQLPGEARGPEAGAAAAAAVPPQQTGPDPTLEEDAAYQHAVCTGALGDNAGAEKEYLAFMRAYPDSPLVPACIKRIARLHGGDVPRADEAVWRQAMDTARAHQQQKERDASLCGPECLAELLRRKGAAAVGETASRLAEEMHTSAQGTSLEALARSARRHGYPRARGLALTARGLSEQALPVIALVAPGMGGHYVLVDRADSRQVTLWDPDAGDVGKGAVRTVALPAWRQQWQGGITLALE